MLGRNGFARSKGEPAKLRGGTAEFQSALFFYDSSTLWTSTLWTSILTTSILGIVMSLLITRRCFFRNSLPQTALTPLAILASWHTVRAATDPTLRDRLEKDLKARRPSEFAFIDRVIELVETNVLPLRLVNATYLWARRQPRSQRPFQYFQRALRLQAARLGIDL